MKKPKWVTGKLPDGTPYSKITIGPFVGGYQHLKGGGFLPSHCQKPSDTEKAARNRVLLTIQKQAVQAARTATLLI